MTGKTSKVDYGALKNFLYIGTTTAGIIAGGILMFVKFVATVEASDALSKANAVKVVTVQDAVTDLTHKIDVTQRTVDEMKAELSKLRAESTSQSVEIAKLQIKIDDFSKQQTEMLKVLLKLNKAVEDGN